MSSSIIAMRYEHLTVNSFEFTVGYAESENPSILGAKRTVEPHADCAGSMKPAASCFRISDCSSSLASVTSYTVRT